jgi:AcrR family transcriptional regulator
MRILSPKRNRGTVALAMNSVLPPATEKSHRTAEAIPSLHERKQQVVRDAIWDAATDLFADKGFNETTVDDIAAAAGVSRRSFFRYFESKNDLMGYAMTSYGDELIAAIDGCPKTHSLYEVLRETVQQVALSAATRPRTEKILGILSKHPDARAAQSTGMAEVQERLTKVLAPRCKPTGEDALAGSMVAAMIMEFAGLTVQWWYDNGRPPMADAVEHTFATLNRLMLEGRRPNRQREAGPRKAAHK